MVVGWLAYLVVERIRLERDREKVPLRIAVTGTRGKTTVVRRLTAVLSEAGREVLAKTTGSEAAYVFPDGTIQEIHRLGHPSIIEQKRLLRRGAKMGVDVALAEVMSLHPENHRVEIHKILQPQLVLVTNFRVDHMEAQGRTREEVASVLALDVPPGATALVPGAEWDERFQELVSRAGGTVLRVPPGEGQPPEAWGEFGPNLDLVWAAARSLDVEEGTIMAGLRNAKEDVGALRSWWYRPSGDDRAGEEWLLVSAFAANDPESTLAIHDRVAADRQVSPAATVGLLALRADRGDRSLQWVQALKNGALSRFGRLLVSGSHAHAVRHALRRHPEVGKIEMVHPGPPDEIMYQLLGGPGGTGSTSDSSDRLVFGFGNIEGLGRTMVRHWRKIGEPYGV
jgi:poly-gamma-glutamate synthase PgsB/CapB